MEICKTCKMTPICTYAGDDYDLPEIFDVHCKFYQENNEKAPEDNEKAPEDNEKAPEDNEKAPENNEKAPEDNEKAPEDNEKAPEDNETPVSEPEKVQEAIDDMIEELDGSESKYPAKKKKRMTAALKKKAADMYNDGAYINQIAEELGFSESEVTKAIKESLGVK